MNNVTFKRTHGHVYYAYVGKRFAARARVNDAGNYVDMWATYPEFRRRGIATALVTFIAKDRKRPLFFAPDEIKNDTIRAMKFPPEVVTSG